MLVDFFVKTAYLCIILLKQQSQLYILYVYIPLESLYIYYFMLFCKSLS